ncbi:hypothetical protein GCM10011584_35320 [Nocardioides phosphati]|uniref:Uncharacterized protein n=1 Tax=Nocardioides phosphati TaxID=1867775 RepID=A0ABQ2NFK9_9ACTN|nr:hypothetical protein [Nocardioides phosphati]GGO94393.1 hypothetical protein GCM10011584_35320 [Nocardioides phosphati]
MDFHRAAHVFVDETKARDYVMAAATVMPGDVNPARKILRGLLLPNQQRIHFTKEKDPRRKQLLTAMCQLDVQVHLYVARTRDHVAGRQACMKAILDDTLRLGATKLVLERDESLQEADRRFISDRFRLELDSPEYLHLAPKDEPMLWVSDAVAWCQQRGGDWRTLCADLVASTRHL